MASERSEDATKGPRPSKSRSFHWTSGLSIIECSHGYDAQTKFKFIVHVDIIIYPTNVWEKLPGEFFGSDIEEWRVFADFEQEDGGVSTTS